MATFASPTLDATLPEDVETLAFEAQKGRVARAIWDVEHKAVLQNVWFVLQQMPPAMSWQKTLGNRNQPAFTENRILENRKKREEFHQKYSMDLSRFKFNRDEANDYEF